MHLSYRGWALFQRRVYVENISKLPFSRNSSALMNTSDLYTRLDLPKLAYSLEYLGF